MSKVEQIIWDLAEPIAQEHNLEIIEVEFVKEGSEWYLRIFIDKDGEEGIDLDDCEKVSRGLSEKLDVKDPIEQAYHLEVSSPGIERPLKRTEDFIRFAGEKAKIRTFVAIDGQKEFIGMLKETTEDEVTLIIDNGEKKIPRDKIAKANLVWEF